LEKRRTIVELYRRRLAPLEEVELPSPGPAGSEHAWHLFIVRTRPDLLEINRDDFIEQLAAAGVGTSVHFIPLHRHPFYQRKYGLRQESFPNAEDAYSRCISLPLYPDLAEKDAEYVAQTVINIVRKYREARSVTI
jgi:dTDP-4-amino-4,6-dideoxygalactose transaminase